MMPELEEPSASSGYAIGRLPKRVIGESRAAELLGISVRELDLVWIRWRPDQCRSSSPTPRFSSTWSGRPARGHVSLPFEFAVPDLLYVRELEGELGDRLIELGLRIEELTGSNCGGRRA